MKPLIFATFVVFGSLSLTSPAAAQTPTQPHHAITTLSGAATLHRTCGSFGATM